MEVVASHRLALRCSYRPFQRITSCLLRSLTSIGSEKKYCQWRDGMDYRHHPGFFVDLGSGVALRSDVAAGVGQVARPTHVCEEAEAFETFV